MTTTLSSSVTSKNEIVVLQYLRGFAAVVVILAHAPTAAMDWTFGAIGVDVFFAISGMVMVLSTQRLRRLAAQPSLEFLRKRFQRIVPLYWLFTLLVIPIYHLGHQAVTFSALWHSLLFIPFRGDAAVAGTYFPVLGVGWTLNYEMFFYVLFAVTLAFRLSPYFLIPFLCLMSLPGFFFPTQPIAFLTLFNFRLLEFAAGMTFAWLYLRGIRFHRWLAIFLGVFSICAVVIGPKASHKIEIFFWCPLALLFTYCMICLEPWIAAHRLRPLELLGDASYSIYLLHVFFVIWPIKFLLRKPMFASRHLDSSLWTILFEVFAACFVGIVVHLLLEKPLMRALGVPIGGRKHPRPIYLAST